MESEKPTKNKIRVSAEDETRVVPARPADTQPAPFAKTIAREPDVAEHQSSSAETIAREVDPNLTEQATRVVPKKAPVLPTVLGDDRTRIKGKSSGVSFQPSPSLAQRYADKKVLKERFVLLELLGAGGMGNVYLAKDLLREEMEDNDPYVAIKVLNDECRQLPGALQSLQREAKKAQALSHPNIVTVYDFDRDDQTAFITMEYIAGDALKDVLRKTKRMPSDKAISVVNRIARGLAYAHQQGFVHADIKPANIFLAHDGTVKILDFGIAKAFTEATKEKKRSLADDLTEGALTPAYASLEMLDGQQALPSDDVYALSCMAYEMIAGRHPFVGEDGLPMPADVAKGAGARVEPLRGVGRRPMAAIRKGLAFDRVNRFENAGEFIDAIKPRNLKKDLMLLGSAAVLTGVLLLGVNHGLQQIVPSVGSLKPELHVVAEAIVEGDGFLQNGDVDMAHRLYSQAWEVTNDLTVDDAAERNKAHAILRDRMGDVSDFLIAQSKVSDMDEYRLRELYVALEFLHKDNMTGKLDRVEGALKDIEKRLETLINNRNP